MLLDCCCCVVGMVKLKIHFYGRIFFTTEIFYHIKITQNLIISTFQLNNSKLGLVIKIRVVWGLLTLLNIWENNSKLTQKKGKTPTFKVLDSKFRLKNGKKSYHLSKILWWKHTSIFLKALLFILYINVTKILISYESTISTCAQCWARAWIHCSFLYIYFNSLIQCEL